MSALLIPDAHRENTEALVYSLPIDPDTMTVLRVLRHETYYNTPVVMMRGRGGREICLILTDYGNLSNAEYAAAWMRMVRNFEGVIYIVPEGESPDSMTVISEHAGCMPRMIQSIDSLEEVKDGD